MTVRGFRSLELSCEKDTVFLISSDEKYYHMEKIVFFYIVQRVKTDSWSVELSSWGRSINDSNFSDG